MSGDRNQYVVGVARVDGDLRDLLAIAQAEMRPRFTCVSGFVNAITDREIGTVQSFTAADVNHIRVRRRYRDGADGARRLRIKNRLPGAAEIVSLPDTTVAHADIELA